MGQDDKVMPHIDMANIACGFHASDPSVMSRTIELANAHNVAIGAHPSYPDLQGFGRRSMAIDPCQLTDLIIYQIGALEGLCRSRGTQVQYVKPHGALYNDMLKDEQIFEAVVDAVSCFNIPLMLLAKKDNQALLEIADNYDVPLLFEAFSDRAYMDDGSLAPRTMKGAVLTDEETILEQVRLINIHKEVISINGNRVELEADTLCVHGDNDESIKLIESIAEILEEE